MQRFIRTSARIHREKLAKGYAVLSLRAQRVDVELTHQKDPRQADAAERIELTVFGKGPIIRAGGRICRPLRAANEYSLLGYLKL